MEEKNRREFFDSFAASSGFDPLSAEKWYSVTKQQLMAHKVRREGDKKSDLRRANGGEE
jgi:hypothetical protein